MTPLLDEKDLWARFKQRDDATACDQLVVNYMSVGRFVAGRLAQVQTAQLLSLDDYLPNEDRDEARKANLTEDTGARNLPKRWPRGAKERPNW